MVIYFKHLLSVWDIVKQLTVNQFSIDIAHIEANIAAFKQGEIHTQYIVYCRVGPHHDIAEYAGHFTGRSRIQPGRQRYILIEV